MLPDGWKLYTVEELFNVQLGKMLNKTARELNPQFEYIGNSNVKWGNFELSNLKTMFFSEREIEKFKLYDGDIIMCEGGEVGRCAIWRNQPKIIYYQKALHRLRSKGNIIPEFFQDFMKYTASTKLIEDLTSRTSIAHLTREKLLRLQVKTPPIHEQTKIAQILSTWDKVITTNEQLLANSQQQKKALMQQLLTGKKRMAGFSGEWKDYHLSDAAQIIMGSSPKSEAYNTQCMGLPLIQGNADISDRKSAPRVFTSEITKQCCVSDILLSVRAPVGSVAISLHQACIGRGVASIKAKHNYSQNYLYQLLLWFEPRWIAYAQGSTFESINSDDIKTLKLQLPEYDEQRIIASVLTNADDEINTLKQKLYFLKEEKKALVQQLLTGKVRVKIH